MKLARRASIVALACTVTLVASACGSGPSAHPAAAASPTSVVLAAYSTTTSAHSADLTFTAAVDAAGQHVDVRGTGQVAFASRMAALALTVPGAGSIEVRTIDGIVYLQLPASARQALPAGKSWIEINLDQAFKDRYGASLQQLAGSAQSPTQTLAYLESASDGVTRVGTATIGGAATTEYAADIDLAKVAATKDAQAKAAVAKLEAQLHRSTLPVHVWIDHAGRLRQMSYSLTVTVQGHSLTIGFTLVLSHFGVPVHVTAPPASATVDASQLGSGATT